MDDTEIIEAALYQLSQESEDSVDSAYIDQIIAEELAKFVQEEEASVESKTLESSEEDKETKGKDEKGPHVRQRSLLHDIVNCLDWLFSPKIMLRITLMFACFLAFGQMYNTLIEAMSKLTILKPRQSRPFFSNSSSKYVQDYFTGDTKPDLLYPKTDLLIVMYYSPWSTYSIQLKHPYEMVAKFLHVPEKVAFTAINCWAPGSLCRSTYKLMNYPVIAAYSKTSSVMYTGPSETDHLYRWVVRLQNHVISLTTSEQLEELQADYQNVLVGYFPFQKLVASIDYSAYAAAGFMLANGNPQDDAIAICTTHSLEVAAQLGIRFEGDIHLLRGSDETVTWPMGRQRTAVNIMDFARRHSRTDSQLQYISKYQEINARSHVFNLLKKSPVLFLVTPLEPMYHQQDEIVLFSKLSEDYWKCDMEVLAQEKKVYLKNRIRAVASDQQACDDLNMDLIQLDGCCRSLLPSVDWNMACASSAKYRWEDEEESHKRRNHWTEEVLPLQSSCFSLRALPASQLVHSCCASYEKITEPFMSDAQKANEQQKLELKQKDLVRQCLRYKLAEHYDYRLNSLSSPFSEESNASATIQAIGCTRNDSLQFAVLDSNTEQFLLKKWGIENYKKPLALIADTSKELFVVMKEDLSQASLQRFVHDFHGNLLNDLMLDEASTVPKFNTSTEQIELHGRIQSQELLTKLTRETFLTLVDNGNSTIDQLVFFTGGGWHGPSTSVLHTIHALSQYFSHTKDLIKFYTVDVSKNELPYNFNFEFVPSIVLFLSGRRDVSWKYPETLPITMPNLISFIVSRCSPRLRWKISLLNCDGTCLSRNAHKLRRQAEKIQKELRGSIAVKNPEKILKWRDFKIHQLSAMRSLLRAISTGIKVDGIKQSAVNRLLKSEHMSSIFAASQL